MQRRGARRESVPEPALQGQKVHPQQTFAEAHAALDHPVGLMLVGRGLLLQGASRPHRQEAAAQGEDSLLVVALHNDPLSFSNSKAAYASKGKLCGHRLAPPLPRHHPAADCFGLAVLGHQDGGRSLFAVSLDEGVVQVDLWKGWLLSVCVAPPVGRVVEAALDAEAAPRPVGEVVGLMGLPLRTGRLRRVPGSLGDPCFLARRLLLSLRRRAGNGQPSVLARKGCCCRGLASSTFSCLNLCLATVNLNTLSLTNLTFNLSINTFSPNRCRRRASSLNNSSGAVLVTTFGRLRRGVFGEVRRLRTQVLCGETWLYFLAPGKAFGSGYLFCP